MTQYLTGGAKDVTEAIKSAIFDYACTRPRLVDLEAHAELLARSATATLVEKGLLQVDPERELERMRAERDEARRIVEAVRELAAMAWQFDVVVPHTLWASDVHAALAGHRYSDEPEALVGARWAAERRAVELAAEHARAVLYGASADPDEKADLLDDPAEWLRSYIERMPTGVPTELADEPRTGPCQACRLIYCDEACECRCHTGPGGAPKGSPSGWAAQPRPQEG